MEVIRKGNTNVERECLDGLVINAELKDMKMSSSSKPKIVLNRKREYIQPTMIKLRPLNVDYGE